MPVAVIADSACALSPEQAARFGIRLVPMMLSVSGASRRDGDVPYDHLLALPPDQVHTSAPTPGEFAGALEATAGADGVLIVTMASALSSTFDAAQLAARLSSHVPVRVVDSETAAGGEALVAIAAARQAAGGGSLDDVTAAAREAAGQVRLVGVLTSLDRLVRGGRVPGIAGQVTRWLGLQPMFRLQSGKVRPLRPARGRTAAMDRVARMWRSSRPRAAHGRDTVCDVVFLHGGQVGGLEHLQTVVRAEGRVDLDLTSSFGAALVAHAGSDVVGMAWRWH